MPVTLKISQFSNRRLISVEARRRAGNSTKEMHASLLPPQKSQGQLQPPFAPLISSNVKTTSDSVKRVHGTMVHRNLSRCRHCSPGQEWAQSATTAPWGFP
jgi:hypothetical protein